MTTEANSITIDNLYGEDGQEVDGSFVVYLRGECADCFDMDEDEFETLVDAHAFAEEVSDETGVDITWRCIKPGWA